MPIQGVEKPDSPPTTPAPAAPVYTSVCGSTHHFQHVYHTGYLSVVMFSTAVPGAVAWAQPPEVFDELFKVCVSAWGYAWGAGDFEDGVWGCVVYGNWRVVGMK